MVLHDTPKGLLHVNYSLKDAERLRHALGLAIREARAESSQVTENAQEIAPEPEISAGVTVITKKPQVAVITKKSPKSAKVSVRSDGAWVLS
jgi:hypothetical protein